MPISTLTSRGRVTIPKEVRERLGLQPGDRVGFRFDSTDRLILRPQAEGPVQDISGLLHHLAPKEPLTVEEMAEGIRSRAADKHRT